MGTTTIVRRGYEKNILGHAELGEAWSRMERRHVGRGIHGPKGEVSLFNKTGGDYTLKRNLDVDL